MEVLLDTCTVIWAILEPERLSGPAREILEAQDTVVHVSPISVAELACAVDRGKLELDIHWRTWFRTYIDANGWQCPPIDIEIIEEAYALPPPFHDDPADRILVATARHKGWHLVTGDSAILTYPHVKTVW